MNRRSLPYLVSALLLAASAGAIYAQDAAPPVPPSAPPATKHDEKTTELGERMHRISKAMKKLKGQVSDPASNDASLALVADIRAAAEEALTFKPEKEADLPPDQQAAFQQNYEDGMKQFIAAVDEFAAALKAGDNAQAATLFANLGKIERKDHHEFRKPHDN
jgi:soluble cytochrome b562